MEQGYPVLRDFRFQWAEHTWILMSFPDMRVELRISVYAPCFSAGLMEYYICKPPPLDMNALHPTQHTDDGSVYFSIVFFECSLHFLLPGDSQLKHNDHLSTNGPNMMFGHKEAMVISCETSAGPQIPLTFWWQEGPQSSMASLPDEPGQLLWCYWTGSVCLQPFAY